MPVQTRQPDAVTAKSVGGLDDSTWGKLRGVLAACADVDEVLLYGSRAKGSFKPGSDIDLALKGEHLDLAIHQFAFASSISAKQPSYASS